MMRTRRMASCLSLLLAAQLAAAGHVKPLRPVGAGPSAQLQQLSVEAQLDTAIELIQQGNLEAARLQLLQAETARRQLHEGTSHSAPPPDTGTGPPTRAPPGFPPAPPPHADHGDGPGTTDHGSHTPVPTPGAHGSETVRGGHDTTGPDAELHGAGPHAPGRDGHETTDEHGAAAHGHAECVPVECEHDAEDCVPVHCAEPDCFPLPCDPSPDHPSCVPLGAPGYNSTFVMCGVEPCVPTVCDHNDLECHPVVCGHEEHEEEDPCDAGHHGDDGLAFWPFMLFALLVSVLVTTVLKALSNGAILGKSVGLPFTVIMFLVGFAASRYLQHDHGVGAALKDMHGSSGTLIDSVDAWKNAHPHVILFCLLPPLLFEDAASMEFYTFRKVLLSSVLLAGPGVVLSMMLTAVTTLAIFGVDNECVADPHTGEEYCGEQLPVSVHLLLGGMLAATDPVAVCAVLNDLGCPDKLNYMIAGESLLNDGTAVVAFLVMQSVVGGCDTDAVGVLGSLVKLAGGGIIWGLLMAAATYRFLRQVNDPNVEISLVLFSTFFTFWCAESVLGVSGVLGTVVFGVQTARTTVLAFDEHTHHASHAFWHEVGYMATAMIFVLAGVDSADKMARFIDEEATVLGEAEAVADSGEFLVAHQLGYNVLLYVIMTGIRATVVWSLSPMLKKIGYGLTQKEAVVMVWGGLRGAVSLSLALLVDGNHLIGERAKELIFMQTVGIVALTLVINGTTSGLVYKLLNVYPDNPFRPMLSTQGLRALHAEMEKVIHRLSEHWFHCNADFEVLYDLLPDFAEAHLLDGDLVNYKLQSIYSVWQKSVSRAGPVNPQRLVAGPRTAAKDSMVLASNVLQGGRSAQIEKPALDPDAYARMGVSKGDFWKFGACDVVAKSTEPVWDDSPSNTVEVISPPGAEPAYVYVHVLDNDYGETDDYLGQAKLDITDMLKLSEREKQDVTKTLELTVCTQAGFGRAGIGRMPKAVQGTVTIEVSCDDHTVSIRIISGQDLGRVTAMHGSEGGTPRGLDDSHGHSEHGHGDDHDMASMLQNARRWISESQREGVSRGQNVEKLPEFAMYDILIQNLKAHFHHMREEGEISIGATSRLYAACGHGSDLNLIKLDTIARMNAGKSEAEVTASNSKKYKHYDENSSPLVAMVDYVVDYCGDKATRHLANSVPAHFYEHKLIAAEVLYALLDAWKGLEHMGAMDTGADGHGQAAFRASFSPTVSPTSNGRQSQSRSSDGFAGGIANGLIRLQTTLATMQLAYPNTFRAVHTQIAYKSLTAQYKHRLHTYLSQGFFTEKVADEVEGIVAHRARELEQFLHVDAVSSFVGKFTGGIIRQLAGDEGTAPAGGGGDGTAMVRQQSADFNDTSMAGMCRRFRADHAVVQCFNADNAEEGPPPDITPTPSSPGSLDLVAEHGGGGGGGRRRTNSEIDNEDTESEASIMPRDELFGRAGGSSGKRFAGAESPIEISEVARTYVANPLDNSPMSTPASSPRERSSSGASAANGVGELVSDEI